MKNPNYLILRLSYIIFKLIYVHLFSLLVVHSAEAFFIFLVFCSLSLTHVVSIKTILHSTSIYGFNDLQK